MMDTSENHRREELENARVGYQAALQHAANEKNMVWVRSSGMLVANSIIIAVLGSLFTTLIKNDLSTSVQVIILLVMFLLMLSGVFLCFLWIVSVERTSKFVRHYVWSARQLEENYLKCPVKTLRRGGRLGKGKKVTICVPGETEPMSISIGKWTKWWLMLSEKGKVNKGRLRSVLRSIRKSAPKTISLIFIGLYVVFILGLVFLPILSIFGVINLSQPKDQREQALVDIRDTLKNHMATEKRVTALEEDIRQLKKQLEEQP